MEFIKTDIEDLLIVQPKVFSDSRGYFFESFSSKVFEEAGIKVKFVQDNQSLSQKGVLRGMHFQYPPHAQGKLVRVIKGSVLDVVLDLRKSSKTYGKHFSIELNETNQTMLWIPEGFAHGFETLADNTIFFYKCTNFYHKESESCIKFNDEALNINWQTQNPILSEKDKLGLNFESFVSPF